MNRRYFLSRSLILGLGCSDVFSSAATAERDSRPNFIVLLCDNLGYPQRWILRRSRSCQNAAWPGRDPVPLSREKPLVLRYRLIIHRGDATQIDLDKLQAGYNGEPAP